MSTNAFEKRVGDWLKAIPDCWSYHPVDSPFGKPVIPGDFIVAIAGRIAIIECKSVQTGLVFPLSRWTTTQRQSCVAIRNVGGMYMLLVHFESAGLTRVYIPDPSIERGSLGSDSGRSITRAMFGATIRGMIGIK